VLGELFDFGVGQVQPCLVGRVHGYEFGGVVYGGVVGVDYFGGFVVDVVLEYCWAVGVQGWFVDVEFVGVDCALDDGFVEFVAGCDEYCVVEFGFGVYGEYDFGGFDVGLYHVLHAG